MKIYKLTIEWNEGQTFDALFTDWNYAVNEMMCHANREVGHCKGTATIQEYDDYEIPGSLDATGRRVETEI